MQTNSFLSDRWAKSCFISNILRQRLIERCLKEIVINPHGIKGRTGQADEGQMKSQVNLWKQSFYYFFRRIHQKTWLGQNIFICINVRISKQQSCKTYMMSLMSIFLCIFKQCFVRDYNHLVVKTRQFLQNNIDHNTDNFKQNQKTDMFLNQYLDIKKKMQIHENIL